MRNLLLIAKRDGDGFDTDRRHRGERARDAIPQERRQVRAQRPVVVELDLDRLVVAKLAADGQEIQSCPESEPTPLLPARAQPGAAQPRPRAQKITRLDLQPAPLDASGRSGLPPRSEATARVERGERSLRPPTPLRSAI